MLQGTCEKFKEIRENHNTFTEELRIMSPITEGYDEGMEENLGDGFGIEKSALPELPEEPDIQTLELFCGGVCGVRTKHEIDGDEAVCMDCLTPRDFDPAWVEKEKE